jgi:hypothetical protein
MADFAMRLMNWENKMLTGDARHPITLAEVSPMYRDLIAKRQQLSNELVELDGERRRLAREIDAAGYFINVDQVAAENAKAKIARVAEIIGDAPVQCTDSFKEYAQINLRFSDLQSAMEILDRKIHDERMHASAIVREKIGGEYKALVAEICDCLLRLHEASAAYHEFTTALNSDGVAWSQLRAMPAKFLGAPTSRNSNLAVYLREAATYDFIKSSVIPEKIR